MNNQPLKYNPKPEETDHEGRPMTYWGGKTKPEEVFTAEGLIKEVRTQYMLPDDVDPDEESGHRSLVLMWAMTDVLKAQAKKIESYEKLCKTFLRCMGKDSKHNIFNNLIDPIENEGEWGMSEKEAENIVYYEDFKQFRESEKEVE